MSNTRHLTVHVMRLSGIEHLPNRNGLPCFGMDKGLKTTAALSNTTPFVAMYYYLSIIIIMDRGEIGMFFQMIEYVHVLVATQTRNFSIAQV